MMDGELLKQELAAAASAIASASHAQDREATMMALTEAITAITGAYGAALEKYLSGGRPACERSCARRCVARADC
jgi:hypothetical protein